MVVEDLMMELSFLAENGKSCFSRAYMKDALNFDFQQRRKSRI
jgi:hypothetical protein